MAKDVEVAENPGEFSAKDYHDPPPAPLIDVEELGKWSLYRALIAEFIATLLFLYITVLTVIGYKSQTDPLKNADACGGVGILGIAWAFGGMIFILVYCTAGISGMEVGPMNYRMGTTRELDWVLRSLAPLFLSTLFSATDPKRNARDSHVPVLAPLPIGFAVFMVHLATIPITGTGINPARSFGAAVIYNKDKAWDDQWIFWVGPFIGAAIAALYHQYILRAAAIKALGSFRSNA
ncbi:hypothetical protein GH714_014352 [Hevea brasiliensis]|uniref:Uncharacterized protein n=1 Tax=Hevea brasiliensis TaxID=3981 RepID=A0A6A6LGM2_HEVBR|nr:hypothetical protein GH714_014352 [Hevea brasiliensis]